MTLRHAELGRWVEASLVEVSDPALRMVAEAYVRRACISSPLPAGDDIVGELVAPAGGLLPWDVGIDALGAAIVRSATAGWRHTPIWIQGHGHANAGLQFHRETWRGTPMTENRFTRDNYNVHGEVELGWEGTWRLKLHFETEPYMTGGRLAMLDGIADFEVMRKQFREAVHDRAAELPDWRMTNYRLQVCAFETNLGAGSTVGEVVAVLANALLLLGPVVDAALCAARG